MGVLRRSFLLLFVAIALSFTRLQKLLASFSFSSDSIVANEAVNNEPASRTRSSSEPNKDRPSRRRFLRYESSTWELEWLSVMGDFVKKGKKNIRASICTKMQQDSGRVQRFLEATCNTFEQRADNWCIVDDSYRPIFFNRVTGAARQTKPRNVRFSERRAIAIRDEDTDLFSRFVYRNEVTNETYHEYIEPLVGYLRHPLSCCELAYNYSARFAPVPGPDNTECFGYLRTSRTQYIHPSHGDTFPDTSKYYYFDAGASEWSSGKGGPSLAWFHDIYKMYGVTFDKMYCYEAETSVEAFHATVPEEHLQLVQYHNVYVRSSVNDTFHPEGPFLPHVIQEVASKDDYVVFKLDIDSPGVEEGNIDFLMDPTNDILEYIDEFFYEFHIEKKSKLNFDGWYENFLYMRQRGVRAHSWI